MTDQHLSTQTARGHVLRAAEALGQARDAEQDAGNTEMVTALNDCVCALYALGVRTRDPHTGPAADGLFDTLARHAGYVRPPF